MYKALCLTSMHSSIQVTDLELRPVLAGSADCPAEAVHGTYLRNWPSIQQHGLSRMNRTHIHLAPGLPGEDGIISGVFIVKQNNLSTAHFVPLNSNISFSTRHEEEL